MQRATLATATPCPVLPSQQAQQHRAPKFNFPADDETANVEYTSAFKVSASSSNAGAGLKNAKPRRRRAAQGVDFAIHEDVEVRAKDLRHSEGGGKGAASAFGKPPQRPLKRVVNFAVPVSTASTSTSTSLRGAGDVPDDNVNIARGSSATASRRLSQAPHRPRHGANAMPKPAPIPVPGADLRSRNHEEREAQIPQAAPSLSRPRLPEDTFAIPALFPDATTTSTAMAKPPRRGTIYIPTEDTTMPSMYMAMFSPIKSFSGPAASSVVSEHVVENAEEGEGEVEATGIVAQMLAKKNLKRHQSNGAEQKPLRPSTRNIQESINQRDRWGQGDGKENVPPGQHEVLLIGDEKDKKNKKSKSDEKVAPILYDSHDRRRVQQLRASGDARAPGPASKLFEATASSLARGNSLSKKTALVKKNTDRIGDAPVPTKPGWNAGPRCRMTHPTPLPLPGVPAAAVRVSTPEPEQKGVSTTIAHLEPGLSVPTRYVRPFLNINPPGAVLDHQHLYPLLTEDLTSLSLYEDNWLKNQEIALAQVLNHLFATTGSAPSCSSPSSPPSPSLSLYSATGHETSDENSRLLRLGLLEAYNSAENVLLHKRLQAAVMFGALSIPREAAAKLRLESDIGVRKQFSQLWLETYDLAVLKAGLEVVVGRECTLTTRTSAASSRGSGGRTAGNNNSTGSEKDITRRALRDFIDTFLVRNADAAPSSDEVAEHDHDRTSLQRTLLRSLMLIHVLDCASTVSSLHSLALISTSKSLSTSPSADLLFQKPSQYKSSASVLKALFALLNPNAGDPSRVLGHVGFVVSYEQTPLAEFEYEVKNIAVDLRDGVRLTRVVEMLLYPSPAPGYRNGDEEMIMVTLPSGETLTSKPGEWLLSQHLKFPCLSRATKLHNVEIALSALATIEDGIAAALVQDIKAEDIVDGYREKTVKLLWGLTSKYGLGALLDWGDVEREIKRLCRVSGKYRENDFFSRTLDQAEAEDGYGYARHKLLLKAWTQAVASGHGIEVKNLTTSFANGRVFEAIVDEYQGYLTCENGTDGKGAITPLKPTKKPTQYPLCERLRNLGCSEHFASLFSTQQHQLFDREFVLAALAFLCSRLLGPTKAIRAAVTIQQAWRSYWDRVLDQRKAKLKDLASACARSVTSVQAGDTDQESRDGGGVIGNSTHESPLQSDIDSRAVPAIGPNAGITVPLHASDEDEEDDVWLNL